MINNKNIFIFIFILKMFVIVTLTRAIFCPEIIIWQLNDWQGDSQLDYFQIIQVYSSESPHINRVTQLVQSHWRNDTHHISDSRYSRTRSLKAKETDTLKFSVINAINNRNRRWCCFTYIIIGVFSLRSRNAIKQFNNNNNWCNLQ